MDFENAEFFKQQKYSKSDFLKDFCGERVKSLEGFRIERWWCISGTCANTAQLLHFIYQVLNQVYLLAALSLINRLGIFFVKNCEIH